MRDRHESAIAGGGYPDLAKIFATPKYFSRREAPPPQPWHHSNAPKQLDKPRPLYIVMHLFLTHNPIFPILIPSKSEFLSFIIETVLGVEIRELGKAASDLSE